MEKKDIKRRDFLKTIATTIPLIAGMPSTLSAKRFQADSLQVWSCGGLSEAFNIVNKKYEQKTGVKILYTGAFAAALGKSLLGNAVTDRVDIMNCIPLIPLPDTLFSNIQVPNSLELFELRKRAARYLPQMHHCRRCSADAVGLLYEKDTKEGYFKECI